MNKRAMTLIEVMIAMALVLLATSAIGWKMHGMIAKKDLRRALKGSAHVF